MTGADAWTKLLALLHDDRDEAARAYESIRERLVKFFAWKGCIDAPELADAVFDRVARKLGAGEEVTADDPAKYVLGVARLMYLETVKKEVRQRRALDRAKAAGEPDAAAATEAEARLRALEGCLGKLSSDNRALVLRYHEGSGQARINRRRELAEQLGVPLNTLRIRLHRMRGQLEDCVRERLAA